MRKMKQQNNNVYIKKITKILASMCVSLFIVEFLIFFGCTRKNTSVAVNKTCPVTVGIYRTDNVFPSAYKKSQN